MGWFGGWPTRPPNFLSVPGVPTHHTAQGVGVLFAIEPNNGTPVLLGEAQVARCGSREIERRTAIRFLFIDFPTAHIGRIGGSYTIAELWLSSSRLPT